MVKLLIAENGAVGIVLDAPISPNVLLEKFAPLLERAVKTNKIRGGQVEQVLAHLVALHDTLAGRRARAVLQTTHYRVGDTTGEEA
jgi:hypothetical protein